MVRRQAIAPFLLLFAVASLPACSANHADPTATRPTHTVSLPDDFVTDETPTAPTPPPPPPNIDGNLPNDAGLTLADAVPFFDGSTRQGRIGPDDDGDAWIIQGETGDTFAITVHNDGEDATLAVHLRDAESRAVVFPPAFALGAGEEAHLTIELSRLVPTTSLLLVVQADTPLDYRLTIRTE